MSVAAWFLLVGVILLGMGLTAGVVRRLPVTTAIVYLCVGLVFGPTVLFAYHFNPLEQSSVLKLVTEIAVLLSLFTAGTKMPVPVTIARWRSPVLLAFAAMAVTAALMAGFGYFALGLPLGAAVLLAGILAPTDPVLATEVQARHPGDRDRLRFRLTCEAGMNDGSAFPVVMLGLGLLGLHDLGDAGTRWLALDVIWATVAGIGVGCLGGQLLAHAVWRMRRDGRGNALLDDFLALGLIGLVYGGSVMIHAWGFLGVFFAAVSLRQTELRLSRAAGPAGRPEAGSRIPGVAPGEGDALPQRVTDGSLVFNEQLERLSEVILILLLGGTLFVNSWTWPAVATAVFLFFCARPIGVFVVSPSLRMPRRLRVMTGWFGVRGIGSLYYLMYAIEHGLPDALALQLLRITLIVVTLSIVIHGMSAKPLLRTLRRSAGAVAQADG